MKLVAVVSTMFYGNNLRLQEGDLYPSDDPLVVEHPRWFTEPTIHRSGEPVQQKPRSRNTATNELDEVTR